MYETEQKVTEHHKYFDCILYYVIMTENIYNEVSKITHNQILSYCLRPSNISNDELLSVNASIVFGKNVASNITFDELSHRGVNSQQLLLWSAPIELVERYEIYLKSPTSYSGRQIFRRCLAPWFGPRCQYKFLKIASSFDQIVMSTFASLQVIDKNEDFKAPICYTHLNCIRGPYPVCLDWREVCDGKIDCLNGGEDERHCFELEMHECEENQYRCHNGMQCIPLEFFDDNKLIPDCLDRTDEPIHDFLVSMEGIVMECFRDPSFRCEEHSCRPALFHNFACGDGQCSDENGVCYRGRGNMIVASMIMPFLHDDAANCRLVLLCVTWRTCSNLCSTADECMKVIRKHCKQSLIIFPAYPALFGHVYFVFSNNRLPKDVSDSILLIPEYLCYDKELCGDILPITKFLPEGLACRHVESEFQLDINNGWSKLIFSIKKVFQKCSTIHDINNRTHCRHSSFYQCNNSSKCISKYRLNDGVQDCHENDDETSAGYLNKPTSTINNDALIKPNLYRLLCDGYIDTDTNTIINETDEIDCEWWPCNNIYTHCNQIWNCRNGIDEINCPYLPKCPLSFYPCVSPETFNLSCLPMDRVSDGIVDCLGASDERQLCQNQEYNYPGTVFRCWNHSSCLDIQLNHLCDGERNCPYNDDELVCNQYLDFGCAFFEIDSITAVLTFLCHSPSEKSKDISFSLRNTNMYPEPNAIQYHPNTSFHLKSNADQSSLPTKAIEPMIPTNTSNEWECNRGIPIFALSKDNVVSPRCLCPYAYYGDSCEYQSQRVSLTLQLQAEADWTISFVLLILLIDQHQNIESHDQIQYLATRDCNAKFDINLLYLTQPKNSSNNYSVRIDAYDKHALTYRASWIFPVVFPFLPVYRISTILTIPFKKSQRCSLKCNHGMCIHYANKDEYACQCDSEWTGSRCNIFRECHCSPHSLCVRGGEPSICICPLRAFGPRCYLPRYSCQSYTCGFRGQCIETDDRIAMNNFTCICDDGYSGERCEYVDTKITISFQEVPIPSSILAHFITVIDNQEPLRVSTFKRIRPDEDSVSLTTPNEFHLLFIQFNNNYYLIIAQEKRIQSANIATTVVRSQQCPNVNQLFNSTVIGFSRLKRMKLNPWLCQQQFEWKCFYDETFMCLCTTDRFANCFTFNHSMAFNCRERHFCENNAQCFQDKPRCPTKSMCVCDECYYGTYCQFSTKGFAISLDAILGYKIRPRTVFARQSMIVKITVLSVIIIFILGIFSSIFSIFTFNTEVSRKVGCGLYLFSTSIVSLLTMIIFFLKFFTLIYTQISFNVHRPFFQFHCLSIDFILRVLLSIGDWLNACVAIERAFLVYKGVNFDQNKSKYIAKRAIIMVVVITTSSIIHDPMHRHLMDDTEEQRTWCITSYSSTIKIYDNVIHFLHFVLPLCINATSAFVIITSLARKRVVARSNQTYKEHLQKLFHQNKYLLISPCILVLLALPRLILSFLSGCMKSARDPWRYLISYFLSLVPAVLTFVVFVLPSKVYKEQFISLIKRFRQNISGCLSHG